MSGNGENEWNVSFGRITFLQQMLQTHSNVRLLGRHDDIVFEIERIRQRDKLRVICIESYAASLAEVRKVSLVFTPVHIIFVGGKWNGYTQEAYDYCLESSIGLYNAGELSGGIKKIASGITRSMMKREIQFIASRQGNLLCTFGFGSFFRKAPYSDVDVLFVVDASGNTLDVLYDRLREDCATLGRALNEKIDLTVFTSSEFESSPLRDMDSLVQLWP